MPMNKEATEENGYLDWKVGMFKTPCESPACCCLNFWCPCVQAYQHRDWILNHDTKNYTYVTLVPTATSPPAPSPASPTSSPDSPASLATPRPCHPRPAPSP
eukprot:TRINITY_DN4372_c1_g1_i2.p4 TRINITY_DN4372_c1_g1~~TRINITY_DN4372_c1_g1_i2.p4  ORF type:complete len:102 (+),score=10.09 TRINITY_DN4372_c1_g1_i2:192-497(+)